MGWGLQWEERKAWHGVRSRNSLLESLKRTNRQGQVSGLLFSGIRRLALSPATKVKGLQGIERTGSVWSSGEEEGKCSDNKPQA